MIHATLTVVNKRILRIQVEGHALPEDDPDGPEIECHKVCAAVAVLGMTMKTLASHSDTHEFQRGEFLWVEGIESTDASRARAEFIAKAIELLSLAYAKHVSLTWNNRGTPENGTIGDGTA